MKVDRRAHAFLEIAGEELGAARVLSAKYPRQAAYLAQQAVEKIARAILAQAGIGFGTSHNIGQMAAALPADHPWRPKLIALDRLSPAATSYRYPAPGGRIVPGPPPADLRADLAEVARLREEARKTVKS